MYVYVLWKMIARWGSNRVSARCEGTWCALHVWRYAGVLDMYMQGPDKLENSRPYVKLKAP